MAEDIIRAYYAAFNAGDMAGFLGLLAEDVVHDISQGETQRGKKAFAAFMEHMNRCYRERIEDVVVMTEATGTRAAAEFVVHGSYIASDPGLAVAARGQSYVLPAGAFFALRDGRISRVSNHYNLADWLRQVS